MQQAVTVQTLSAENRAFAGSGGISRNARPRNFQPGFYDVESGEMVISRFANGRPAPVHLLEGLPGKWVTGRDDAGRVLSVKGSVVSGFICKGCFYSRAETAELVRDRR